MSNARIKQRVPSRTGLNTARSASATARQCSYLPPFCLKSRHPLLAIIKIGWSRLCHNSCCVPAIEFDFTSLPFPMGLHTLSIPLVLEVGDFAEQGGEKTKSGDSGAKQHKGEGEMLNH